MNEKFKQLNKLGVGEFEHLNGSLIEHLQGTFDILKDWHSSQELCDAGLYHAAYGTAGFDTKVVALSQRQEIAGIIGTKAEEIVYLYCACDRDFVNEKLGESRTITFKDRFTGSIFQLTAVQARQFCELTVANELELAIKSDDFIEQYGQELLDLFKRMSPYLTQTANQAVDKVLSVA